MNSREKFLSVMLMDGSNYSGVEIPKIELYNIIYHNY